MLAIQEKRKFIGSSILDQFPKREVDQSSSQYFVIIFVGKHLPQRSIDHTYSNFNSEYRADLIEIVYEGEIPTLDLMILKIQDHQ